jgi:hypothetical protein
MSGTHFTCGARLHVSACTLCFFFPFETLLLSQRSSLSSNGWQPYLLMVGSKQNQEEEEEWNMCNMMIKASPQVTISYSHFTQ